MKDDHSKKKSIHNLIQRLAINAPGYRTLLIILAMFVIAFLSFAAGVNLDKAKYGSQIKAAIELNWRIPINIYKGLVIEELEEIDLAIKHLNLQKLYFANDYALSNNYGLLDTEASSYVPLTINYNDNKYKAKTRVKGNWIDSRSNDKLSLRIKLPNDNTIMGMKRFSIHDPKVKSYLSEWLFHELLKHEDLIAARYDFIKVAINGDKKGIFAIEEHFDKRLIENNKRREGLILKLDETNQVSSFKQKSEDQKRNFIMDYQKDSYSLSPFNTYNKVLEDKKLYDQFQLATSMFEAFRSNKLSTKDVFDLEQLAKLVALTDLLGERHNLKAKNIKFYFNPVTSRIEPIGYDQHLPTKYLNKLTGEHRTVLGETDTLDLLDQIFNDYNFYVLYVKYLHKYSEKSYLENFYKKIKTEYEKKLNITYRANPLYIDNTFKILAENQSYIRNKLNPSQIAHAYFDNYADNTIKIKIGNVYSSPIEIIGLSYKGKKYLYSGQSLQDSKLESKKIAYRTYVFEIDNAIAIEGLDLSSLKVISKIVGGNSEVEDEVFPWPLEPLKNLDNAIFSKELDLSLFNFLNLDGNNIFFEQGKFTLSKDLILPVGFNVYLKEGTQINLINGASIISYSPITALGTEKLPIEITSSDGSGGGMLIINTSSRTLFEYTNFSNLSNPTKFGWELTGAITAYQADVSFNKCLFRNNVEGDDFLNIIRSDFDITSSVFSGIKADAFDSDFSVGEVRHSKFLDIGNDSIDTSGSAVHIENIDMRNVGDKGISVGEESSAVVNKVKIDNGNIAIASKDNSTLEINDLTITNSNFGLTAFQKKTEFGPSSIIGSNVKIDNVVEDFLIEEGSYCKINDQIIEANKDNLKEVIYL